jgi:hypothetical protein
MHSGIGRLGIELENAGDGRAARGPGPVNWTAAFPSALCFSLRRPIRVWWLPLLDERSFVKGCFRCKSETS